MISDPLAGLHVGTIELALRAGKQNLPLIFHEDVKELDCCYDGFGKSKPSAGKHDPVTKEAGPALSRGSPPPGPGLALAKKKTAEHQKKTAEHPLLFAPDQLEIPQGLIAKQSRLQSNRFQVPRGLQSAIKRARATIKNVSFTKMPAIGFHWPITRSTSPKAASPSMTCLENDDVCILEREEVSSSEGITDQDTLDVEVVNPKDLYLDKMNSMDEEFETSECAKDAGFMTVTKDGDKCSVKMDDVADLAKGATINLNWTVLDQQAPPNIREANKISTKNFIPVKHFPKPQNSVSSDNNTRQPFLSPGVGATTTKATAHAYEKSCRKNYKVTTERLVDTRSENPGRTMDESHLPPASIPTPTILHQAAADHYKVLLEARILAEDDRLFGRYVKHAKKGTIDAFMAALPHMHQDRKQPINILWVKGAGALARRVVFADTRSSMSREGQRLLVGAWKGAGAESWSRNQEEDEEEEDEGEGEELGVMEEYVKFVREATRGRVGKGDVEAGTQDAPFWDFMRRTWILFRSEDGTTREADTTRKYYLLDFNGQGNGQGDPTKKMEGTNNKLGLDEQALTAGQKLAKQADDFTRVLERTSAAMRAGDATAHERREHLRKLAQARRCSKPE